MSNGTLAVTVDEQGTVQLEHDGRNVMDIVGVECREDVGDLYTPAIRAHGAVPPRVVATHLLHEGPWRAALAIDWEIPAVAGGEVSRMQLVVSLGAGESFVRFGIRGDHRGRDQRIRLLLRTGVADAQVWADAAFGPVERKAILLSPAEAAAETPPPTAPLHRYVSLFAPAGGATVFSDGLGEYEAMEDGTVAITLVRAVGELSRHDLQERPGHAGWPVPTPGAQCEGPFEAELALLPHGGIRDAVTIDAIERTADDVLLPLVGDTLRSALHLPDDVHGVALEGAGLAFSAMKDGEDRAWTVVRCVNLLDSPVDGAWRFGWSVAEAQRARLDETPVEALPVTDDGRIAFTAGAREVVTVLVRSVAP